MWVWVSMSLVSPSAPPLPLQIAQSQNRVYLNAENLMLNLQGFDLDEA